MSLRARLLLAVGAIALVALVVADIATYQALGAFLNQRVDQNLEQIALQFEHGPAPGQGFDRCLAQPSGAGGPGGAETAPGGGPPSNANATNFVELRTATGAVIDGQQCPAYLGSTAYSPALPSTITGFATDASGQKVASFDAPSTTSGGPEFRVRATELADGSQLVVAAPLGDTGDTLHDLLLIELAVSAAALVIALAGGFWLVRIGLRPLTDVERSAESIAEGDLTHRVPGENPKTEVGRLAGTLNVMLGRIEAAFGARVASEQRLRASEQRLRQFVADASHELRTPIAAVSAYAELFGRGASEQKEDLERVMNGIRTETDRMERLVADLLQLARLDEGRLLEQRPVELVSLCAEAVATASTVGPGWPLTFEAAEPVEVVGDATSLRQVIDNLLANVRAHTPVGTTARVTVAAGADEAVVTVADDGPGMAPDEAAHVFERFYRADPSRARSRGGSGLGLSIVAAIVEAHGGTVSAEGRPGHGTTFTVTLPMAPAEVEGAV